MLSDYCTANLALNLIIIFVGCVLSIQVMILSEHLNGKDGKKK